MREAWDRHIRSGGLRLDTEVDGMPIIDGLFQLAAQLRAGTPVVPDAIESVFQRHVVPLELTRLSANP